MTTRTTAHVGPVGPTAPRSGDVDARLFWSWVWQSVNPVLGWILIGAGFIAIGLGWWGVAGHAIVAQQLPYLASGGVVGLGLITLGGRLLMVRDQQRDADRLDRIERAVGELRDVLLVAAPSSYDDAAHSHDGVADGARHGRANGSTNGRAGAGGSSFLVVPGGTSYHRAGCAMTEHKEGVSRVRSSTVARRQLRPCPLCEPAVVDG